MGLGMVEGVDFTLLDVQQRNNGRGSNIAKSYILTPESFKKCLMRSRRHAGQPVDPVIYSRYFLSLDSVSLPRGGPATPVSRASQYHGSWCLFLGLVWDVDYPLRHMSEPVKQGGYFHLGV